MMCVKIAASLLGEEDLTSDRTYHPIMFNGLLSRSLGSGLDLAALHAVHDLGYVCQLDLYHTALVHNLISINIRAR